MMVCRHASGDNPRPIETHNHQNQAGKQLKEVKWGQRSFSLVHTGNWAGGFNLQSGDTLSSVSRRRLLSIASRISRGFSDVPLVYGVGSVACVWQLLWWVCHILFLLPI